ncbi:Uncharacterised protein [uncultured archaeon]|nr:Uncharacterised protein [uncultured archaeon]
MTEVTSGKIPAPADIFWKDIILDIAKASISSIEESAKHLIAAASFLEGVYFHAISFADLKIVFGSVRYYDYHWQLVSLFSLPILLWFVVLACATLVLTTKTYTVHPEEPEDARRVFEQIASTKQRWLMRGLYILMVSFVVLFVDIFIFLGAK